MRIIDADRLYLYRKKSDGELTEREKGFNEALAYIGTHAPTVSAIPYTWIEKHARTHRGTIEEAGCISLIKAWKEHLRRMGIE